MSLTKNQLMRLVKARRNESEAKGEKLGFHTVWRYFSGNPIPEEAGYSMDAGIAQLGVTGQRAELLIEQDTRHSRCLFFSAHFVTTKDEDLAPGQNPLLADSSIVDASICD